MTRGDRRRREAQSTAASTSGATSTHKHSFSLAELGVRREEQPVPAVVHRVSEDKRRIYQEELSVNPPSPVKRLRLSHAATSSAPPAARAPRLDPTEFSAFSINIERYELFTEQDQDDDEVPQRAKHSAPRGSGGARPQVKPSDVSLDDWRAKRDSYLEVLLRRDGRGGDTDEFLCPGCDGASKQSPTLRCRDCFGDLLYCAECMVEHHRDNPLHRLECWSHSTFVPTSLATLGLRIQFGHPPHKRCSAPDPAAKDFVVLHTNGIHEVNIDFCGCENAVYAGTHEIQLLRGGWFPATHERPRTAATLVRLEEFQMETLQSKMSMYDGYAVMEKLTDNTGIKPANRYHEWLRMCREFRHLRLLKRGGRATPYDPSGVDGTQQGELALECPACPRPGVNLEEGAWENAEPEQRFLFTLFIALDACFRLKRRLVSSELKDPDLGSGWAYMVGTEPYRAYLRTVTNQEDMKSCSGLAALDYANTKFSRGYSTTGVGMGVCARHEFVQPNGAGDLQKGERFTNMDYIFGSILKHKHHKLPKTVTYDIVCSWAVNLVERLKTLPPMIRLLVAQFLSFAIPKLHIHGHTLACQLLFSLNLLLGSAQLDAEGIERAWSSIGGVAASTRDMGPGSRHDTLDCHWAFWNWQKLVDIVHSLRRRRDRAAEELKEQMEAFEEFSAQQAENVPEWKQQVLDWELDSRKFNPFEIKVEGVTEAQVRLRFAKEEAAEEQRGVPSVHDVSPSSFMTCGLDLEGEQRRVRVQAELKKAQTTEMEIDIGGMRRRLNGRIARFRKLQAVYMPAALQVVGAMELPPTILAEDVPLVLPSALMPAQREGCIKGLEDIEAVMRDAQCRTALVRLRNQLHVKSRLFTYKRNHARAQGPNTKARTIVARNESKIRLHSEKYQTAWEALRRLNDGDDEMVGWTPLRKKDIRCMQDPEDLKKKARAKKALRPKLRQRHLELRSHGMLEAEEDEDMQWMDVDDDDALVPENRRQVSWIWRQADADGTEGGMRNALRVEWCKAFARTRRWTEEMRLLEEEYRRVGVTFEHEAKKWEARAAAVPLGLQIADAEGAVAYALRQAAMYRDLKARGEKTWTEEKLARGKKRRRHVPAAVGVMEADAAAERILGTTMEVEVDEVDEVDEIVRGEVEEDEEYILGGGGYDD